MALVRTFLLKCLQNIILSRAECTKYFNYMALTRIILASRGIFLMGVIHKTTDNILLLDPVKQLLSINHFSVT